MDSADDAEMDGKPWIQCDACYKWNHTDCEISLGADPHYRTVAEDSKRQEELEQEKERLQLERLKNLNDSKEEGKEGDKNGLDTKSAIDNADGLNQSGAQEGDEQSQNEQPYFCVQCRRLIEEKKAKDNPRKQSQSKKRSNNNSQAQNGNRNSRSKKPAEKQASVGTTLPQTQSAANKIKSPDTIPPLSQRSKDKDEGVKSVKSTPQRVLGSQVADDSSVKDASDPEAKEKS